MIPELLLYIFLSRYRPEEYFIVQKPTIVQQQIESKEPIIEMPFQIKLNKNKSIEDIIFKYTHVINPKQLKDIVLEFKTETGVWHKEDINEKNTYSVLLNIPRNYTEAVMNLRAEINENKKEFSLYQYFEDKELSLLRKTIGIKENTIFFGKYHIKRIDGSILEFFNANKENENYISCISTKKDKECSYNIIEKRIVPFILQYTPHNIKREEQKKVIYLNQDHLIPITIINS